MTPCSQDLRERVLAKASAGKETRARIAATFGISLSTLQKWLRRRRATGKTTPLPPAHGPQPILEDHAALIRAEVKRQPDIPLVELGARLSRCVGLEVSPSTLCRELQRLRLPRKKKSLHDSLRDTPRVRRLRHQLRQRITEGWSPRLAQLKFIDESGTNLGFTRRFGRARPGQRVVEGTPGDAGPHYTLIGALTTQGVQAPAMLEGY